jgi:hypothetical protein
VYIKTRGWKAPCPAKAKGEVADGVSRIVRKLARRFQAPARPAANPLDDDRAAALFRTGRATGERSIPAGHRRGGGRLARTPSRRWRLSRCRRRTWR